MLTSAGIPATQTNILSVCGANCVPSSVSAGLSGVSTALPIAFVTTRIGQASSVGVRPMCSLPQPTPAVSCFAQLKYRSAHVLSYTHSFWYIQDSSGTQKIIDGGPSISGCKAGYGYLVDWVNPAASPHYLDDNVNQGTWFDTDVSSNSCALVDQLELYAYSWPDNSTIYIPTGPNSNRFAHDCADAVGYSIRPPWLYWLVAAGVQNLVVDSDLSLVVDFEKGKWCFGCIGCLVFRFMTLL